MRVLFKAVAWVAYQVVQEYRDLEELALVQLSLAPDDDIGADDPTKDVYAETVGFSAQQGRLRRED